MLGTINDPIVWRNIGAIFPLPVEGNERKYWRLLLLGWNNAPIVFMGDWKIHLLNMMSLYIKQNISDYRFQDIFHLNHISNDSRDKLPKLPLENISN